MIEGIAEIISKNAIQLLDRTRNKESQKKAQAVILFKKK